MVKFVLIYTEDIHHPCDEGLHVIQHNNDIRNYYSLLAFTLYDEKTLRKSLECFLKFFPF